MQFELPFVSARQTRLEEQWLRVGAAQVRLWFCRHPRARRYVLRLRPDGAARVTVPRGGSVAEARRFAEKNIGWLERQLLRQAVRDVAPKAWTAGTTILFRGQCACLKVQEDGTGASVQFGLETIRLREPGSDLRADIEHYLWRLAKRELPSRVFELAALHDLPARRVSVRNQRSRWGSCSRRGTISLNWRLVQAPLFVRDYIILHELAHLKNMNHSRRFWREVARLCPEFSDAERWLKEHSELLH